MLILEFSSGGDPDGKPISTVLVDSGVDITDIRERAWERGINVAETEVPEFSTTEEVLEFVKAIAADDDVGPDGPLCPIYRYLL